MADINNQATGQPEVVNTGVAATVPAQPVQPVAPALNTDNDRTREEFQKLLESNQKLYASNEALRQTLTQQAQQQQFAQPQQVQQTPVVQQAQAAGVDPRDFIEVDPTSGERFINEQKLRSKVTELETIAKSSAQRFDQYVQTQEQRELQRMEAEAYQVHPELNPADPKFDNDLNKLTRAVIWDSMVNPQEYGGKAMTPREAGDYAKKQLNRQPTNMVNQAPEQNQDAQAAQAAQALKEQGAQALPGQQPPVRQEMSDEDMSKLQVETRRGSLDALAKRLMNTDHKKSDSEAS